MKRKTIRNHKDFFVSSDDFKMTGLYFITKAKPAKIIGDARYGLIASKRTFKLAVQRNRAKRLLRDWIAFNEDLMLPDFDYVFIARFHILDCSRELGRKKMANMLKRIAKLYKKNAKSA